MRVAFKFCQGGPWNGKKLMIKRNGKYTTETPIFKVGNFHGKYVAEEYTNKAIWQNAPV